MPSVITGVGMLDELVHVLLLRDYNTRLVVGSTALLGAAAGLIGSFMLLRKRALMADALSHAMLPGICVAFMILTALGVGGKSLPGLLLGAGVFGMIGVVCVMLIRDATRLKDDAAMGIVLSVFFGLGVALMGLIQRMATASQSGIESFIYGAAAGIVMRDFILIAAVCVVVVAVCAILTKELTLLCFDEAFASAIGRPVRWIDLLLLALLTLITVVGLQSVGLILIIAMLIIPAAAARFWTERLRVMLITAALIGFLSGWVGSSLSALYDNLPAGAIIVLVASVAFILSMVFGSARGLFRRWIQRHRLARTVARQHLLRAIFEVNESLGRQAEDPVVITDLVGMRAWSRRELAREVRRSRHARLIERHEDGGIALTQDGIRDAARHVRNHRLWEMYLITHADIAPSHVDRDADRIEHILAPELIDRLERALVDEAAREVPPSPHVLPAGGAA